MKHKHSNPLQTFGACRPRRALCFLTLLLAVAATGCRHTGSTAATNLSDETTARALLEPLNRASYRLTDTLDRALLKPLAVGYQDITPKPLRHAITNFFRNLSYGGVVVNDFLQGKVRQGMEDLFRIIVNSSFGIGGLVDMASDFGLPRHEEDLGQTLAVWGVPAGPYLFLPLLGPSTARNLPNFALDAFLDPVNWLGNNTYQYSLNGLELVNTRAELLQITDLVEESALDPYTFIQEGYLQRREYLVYDGNPPLDALDDEIDALFEEEETEKTAP